MLLPYILLLPLAQQHVAPQPANWQELRMAFPEPWEFPQADASGRPLASATFEDHLRRLAQEPLVGTVADADAFFLGDFVRTCDALNWKPTLVQLLFDHLAKKMAAEDIEMLKQLLFCDGLAKSDWDPTKTKHDGLAFGPTWELPEDCWMDHKGTRSIEQSAILILADLATIKEVEHDFPSYFRFPDNSYMEIQPQPGRYLRVPRADRTTCDAASLNVAIRADLPFPFSNYTLDLSILHRQRDSEDLITYVHGLGEDIHWMAGYDRYWTVHDGQGKPVCTLIVRQLAFEIAGVPDKSKHRQEGIRSGLGNLRRNAEGIFRGDWPAQDAKACGIPEFQVMVPVRD